MVGPHVVLSVQSPVVRQAPPTELAKHRPPLHLPERHWLSVVHVVPGQEARQVPGEDGVPEQLPLWHCPLPVQAVPLP